MICKGVRTEREIAKIMNIPQAKVHRILNVALQKFTVNLCTFMLERYDREDAMPFVQGSAREKIVEKFPVSSCQLPVKPGPKDKSKDSRNNG